jgi:ADP-ribose pyrophosphatase
MSLKGQTTVDDRGSRKRYEAIRKRWGDLFTNPPGASFEIVFDDAEVQEAEQEEEARLVSKGRPTEWSHTGVVYEDPYIIVVRDAIRRPDGTLGTYVRTLPASGAAGVVVLPIFDGKIVLLQHFRHATRKNHLEAPRGFGESGVAATLQARNELFEEIGAHVDDADLADLGKFHSNDGIASDCVELFLARIDRIGDVHGEEGITGFKVYSPRDVAGLISTGEISDSFTIGAFTRAWLRGLLPGWPAPTNAH